ncbi:MAG: hypothetical protein KTV77_05025, partial [Wolbachia endosymbiont of Fragariocoptes setiger]|nr:hypothetical protein [Wolbachia endosymbiont of Fragariocoptes setiger]
MADVSTSSIASLFNYIEKVNLTNEISQATTVGDIKKYKELIRDRFINISSDDRSIIHSVLSYNPRKIEIQKVKEMINVVLQSGIDINYYNELGQTPLEYFLQESLEKKYPIKYREEITKFLLERGAKYDSNKLAGNDSLGFIEEGIFNNLKEDIKREFNKYITNEEKDHIIEKISIDGICANVTLNTNTKLRVSEFLQSKFCQDKGIYAFNTSFNGEEEIHGFISFDGIRHYTVTKGVYEMKLNWYCGGKEYTIDIKISSQGVELINRNGVTDEQISANKDVIINGLSLLDGIKRGVQKNIKLQQSFNNNETIRSTENYKEFFNVTQNSNSIKHDIASFNNESIQLLQKEGPLIGLNSNSIKFEGDRERDKGLQAPSMNSTINNLESKDFDGKRNNSVDSGISSESEDFIDGGIKSKTHNSKKKLNRYQIQPNKSSTPLKGYSGNIENFSMHDFKLLSPIKKIDQELPEETKNHSEIKDLDRKLKNSVDSGISSDDRGDKTSYKEFVTELEETLKEKNRGLKYVENKPKDYSTSQDLFKNEEISENKSLNRKRNNSVDSDISSDDRGDKTSYKEFITELEETLKEKNRGLKYV